MIKRIWIYTQEMYPLLPGLVFAFLFFFGQYALVSALSGKEIVLIGTHTIIGCLTFYLFLFFLRISDEFKDYETDKALFPERPLPSGRVHLKDLKMLMAAIICLKFILNLSWGNAVVPFVILFGYGVLMFKYFFLPRYISKSLVLAFITHNPSILFINFYIISIFCFKENVPVFSNETICCALVYWLPAMAWELSRKVRAPKDENEYETYSKIFGYKLAAILPVAIITIHYALIWVLGETLKLSCNFMVVITLSLICYTLPFLRFSMNPNSKTAKLRPFSEAYVVIFSIALLIEFTYRGGISWNLI